MLLLLLLLLGDGGDVPVGTTVIGGRSLASRTDGGASLPATPHQASSGHGPAHSAPPRVMTDRVCVGLLLTF